MYWQEEDRGYRDLTYAQFLLYNLGRSLSVSNLKELCRQAKRNKQNMCLICRSRPTHIYDNQNHEHPLFGVHPAKFMICMPCAKKWGVVYD